MIQRYIILDRDGVINQDSDNYIKSAEEWIPLPGSLEAIARLNQAGYSVAVATNQSGIARGLFDQRTLNAMHQKFHRELASFGAHVDLIAWCPHGPEDDCPCRKPKPGLYQEIARRWDVSLENMPIVGDSLRDLEAAVTVKAKPILVRTGKGERTVQNLGDLQAEIFDDLAAVVEHLLREEA